MRQRAKKKHFAISVHRILSLFSRFWAPCELTDQSFALRTEWLWRSFAFVGALCCEKNNFYFLNSWKRDLSDFVSWPHARPYPIGHCWKDFVTLIRRDLTKNWFMKFGVGLLYSKFKGVGRREISCVENCDHQQVPLFKPKRHSERVCGPNFPGKEWWTFRIGCWESLMAQVGEIYYIPTGFKWFTRMARWILRDICHSSNGFCTRQYFITGPAGSVLRRQLNDTRQPVDWIMQPHPNTAFFGEKWLISGETCNEMYFQIGNITSPHPFWA